MTKASFKYTFFTSKLDLNLRKTSEMLPIELAFYGAKIIHIGEWIRNTLNILKPDTGEVRRRLFGPVV
jgi:hypothetical protein